MIPSVFCLLIFMILYSVFPLPASNQWNMAKILECHYCNYDVCEFHLINQCISVQSSCSVVSDSLQPYELQHARPPCLSPTPRAYPNSRPLSQWCYPTISSSVVPSPPSFSLSQHQGLFQWVSSLHQMAKVLELQLQHQSFQWIFRTDFLQDWLVWSPCSPRDSQESSPTPQFKSTNSSVLSFLHSPTFTPIHDHWKNHSLD